MNENWFLDHDGGFWTILHFCAKFSLPRLAELLLTKPGAMSALNSQDSQGRVPVDIALTHGDKHLVEILTR